jgi:hypothetical protein
MGIVPIYRSWKKRKLGMEHATKRKESCPKCYYYQFLEGYVAECRLEAPKLIIHDDILMSVFPNVDDDFWCGKFKPKN